VRFDQPIYTVISNQKVAKFKTPREPLYRLSLSQKLLFFFKSSVVNVSVSIDSQFFGTAIQSIDNKNLYVPPWNASFYNDGHIHTLSIEVKDNQNNRMRIENEFSRTPTTITAFARSKFILLIHWPTFLQEKTK
ncbi:unnamed protein product, partial [Rotaria sordida]